jgi:hypothetical protein
MNFLRKFVAIVVMILSAVGFVACVGGIVGAWAVKDPATQTILSTLTTADEYLLIASQTSGAVTTIVGDTSTRLAEIQTEVPNILPDQRAVLATQAQALVAPVQRVSSTALALEAGLTSINDTLTTVSRLPGLGIEPPPEELMTVGSQLGQVGRTLDTVQATLADVHGDGSRITALIGDALAQLAQVEGRLQELNTQIAMVQQISTIAQARTPGLLNLSAIGLTFLLILMAAGQASLFAHGLGWFGRR